jgi:hypothetical protein
MIHRDNSFKNQIFECNEVKLFFNITHHFTMKKQVTNFRAFNPG